MAESNPKEIKDEVNEQKTDDDLDSLLDSALNDFTELSKPKPAESKPKSSTTVKEEDDPERMWSDMMKQVLEVDPAIRDMFQQGSCEGENLLQDFTKIAEAAAKVIEGNEAPSSFADIMTETLRNLNESSETIQNQFGNPEEMANLFQDLGLNGASPGPDGSFEDFPPFMQSIMQSFLSKEVLYPAMKEFVEKYPAWLEEHKDTLPSEDYENYCKQLEVMKKVLEEFEAESESDSEEEKKQRFQRTIGLMQQMQALGHPPPELLGGDMPLDESAMPNLPPGLDPNQCSMM